MPAATSTHSPASLHLRPAADDQPHEPKPRLIWLLHFHKAAGTSFTTLAGQNGETKRMRNVAGGMDDPHSHLELDRASGLRWPLIVALSRRPPPRGCTNEVGLARSVLPQEIGRLVAANVTFVSTEHWFPDLTAAPLPRLVKLVVVFRDPMQRLLSSYLYHGCGDNRCPATARCRLSTWARAEANLYVRMLSGDPFGPVWMPRQCTQGYARRPVGQRALDAAARALARFDLVVTLGLLSGRNHGVECALRRVLGWRRTQLPRANERAAARRHCPGVPEVDAAETARAREENRWDIELFGRARHAEASILRRVGCMARHLAPAGVDDDWESALASAAVGRNNGTAGGSVRAMRRVVESHYTRTNG